ncbi:MAG TPA: VWA domain-containing protein [Kofleriaceae bacterium]|nr:VWA domain-containing protein [Kofleriaceae bacterium]
MIDWLDRVRFATWWMVVVAGLAPLGVVAVAWGDRARRRSLMARLGDVAVVQRMMASVSPTRRLIKRALLAAAVALIALAAARPQTPGTAERSGHGLDLVIALDASKSMMVDDVGGTRLARARSMIKALLGKLDGDRIASVVFAGAPAHFPLTEDEDVALSFLTDIGPMDLPPGSDLAGAIRSALCILRPDEQDVWSGECTKVGGQGHGGDPLPGEADEGVGVMRAQRALEDRGKVVLVLTDGAAGLQRAGGRVDLEPVEQVRRAVGLGVTVLLVGVGTETGGLVPELDDDGRPHGQKLGPDGRPVLSKLDRDSLGLLAEAAGGTGGHYFELGAGGDPDPGPLVSALARVKRGGLESSEDRVMIEHYPGFLFAGFMLLVIEACIGTRRRVANPEG